MDINSTKTIASVTKALNILELISQYEDGLTTTEISNMTNQGVSSTYHLLNTLRVNGYIRQDKNKRFYIGYTLLRIAKSAKAQFSLANLAEESLKILTAESNETSNLVILKDSNIEYIAQCECSQMLKMFTKIGAQVPYNCTGGGKAIAAYLPKNEQRELLNTTNFKPYTKKTCLSWKELEKELEEIRKNGFALDDEEREIGVTCIAAPVFSDTNYPIAAVSISGPTSRIQEKDISRLSGLVKAAAQKISNDLVKNI